jgi:1,4-alpha-glucan branching enzyme
MRKGLVTFIFFTILINALYPQNAIVGTGFSSGWGGNACPTGNSNFNYFSNNLGGTFVGVLTPQGTGNQFFRLGVDWSSTTAQKTITIGSDVAVSPNTEYKLNSSCTTSGAMFYNVPNTNYRYVFKTKDGGVAPKDSFIFFEVHGDVRTISAVSQSPISANVGGGQDVTVTATTNGNLNTGQSIFIRYTNNNWTSSTIAPMNSSGTIHTFQIPGFNAGTSLQYYVFTSSPNVTINQGNVDFYTFNANTNSGQNYSYTVKRVTVTPILPNENDLVTITFDASNSPLQGAQKVYLHSGVSSTSTSLTTFNHTVGNWGQDDNIGVMTNTTGNIWTISLNPNLRSFYNVPSEKDLFGLNFLFRNVDGTLKEDNNGLNYFNAIDPGNYFTITTPTTDPFFASVNTQVTIASTANTPPTSWAIDEIHPTTGVFISAITSGASTLSFMGNIMITDTTLRRFRVTAQFANGNKSKTIGIKGFNNVTLAPRPSWVKPGINYHPGDPTKATLVLHCPTYTRFLKGTGAVGGASNTAPKSIAYVIGDFNNWTPTEAYKMNRDRDGWDGIVDLDNDNDRGDYWWVTLEGLTPGQEYVFQYLIDGSIRVADPYSHKISDPEDFQISSSTFPGLITYRPQAVDRASVLQTNRPQFTWTAPSFSKPTPDRLNIYEMHFRDFTEEGTYLAAIDKLDYIKSLGINAIHVMPVSEFEGNSSWGYNPNFYFAVDKAYGPENDLKTFIDECHKRQIQVFNDVVLNHAFYSNVMAKLYWNTTLNRPANDSPYFNPTHKMVRNQAGWWGADWNHESQHVQAMVDSILGYWLKEFKFDGFRFDFTKGFGQTDPNDFPPGDDWASSYNQDRIDLLKRMVDRMWTHYSGSVTIFEHLANSNEDKVLADYGILMWSGVGHHNDLKGFILGFNGDNTNIYNSGVYNAAGRNFQFANWMSYGESHDEQRLGYELMQFYNGPRTTANMIDRLKIAYGFNLLLPGPRMLWQFGELGYEVDINENGRTGEKPVRWHYYDDPKRKELYRLISRIFTMRNNHNLYETAPNFDNIGQASGTSNPRIMKLATNDGKHVIVVANLDPNVARDVTPLFPLQGTWHRYNGTVDGSTFEVTNANQNGTYLLAASEMLIFTNFQIVPCTNVTEASNTGEGSLRNAIECSTTNSTITFESNINNITLTQPIDISKNIELDRSNTTPLTINGANVIHPYIFKINPNVNVTLKNLNILTNTTSNAVLNEGNLIINNVRILKN